MITLTRLNGAAFALNDQLVERVEANPDTVVVLMDGKKFIVVESVDEVVDQIRQARADVAHRSSMIEIVEAAGPELRLINGRSNGPSDGEETDGGIDDGGSHPVDQCNDHTAKEGNSWTP